MNAVVQAISQDIQRACTWWASLGDVERYDEWKNWRSRNKQNTGYDTMWKFVASSARITEQWIHRGRPML